LRATRLAGIAISCTVFAATGAAQENPPLPEGNAYVRSLLAERRQQDDAISAFTYDLEEAREHLSKKGIVTSKTTLKYHVYFVKSRQVRRLISRNGVPLSPKEQASVDRKAEQRARDIREGKVVTEQLGVRLSNLFETFDFKTVGRSEPGGRSALELDFQPRRDRPRGPEGVGVGDGLLKMLGGRVVIDELDKRVVRLEARNDEHLSASVATGVKLGSIDFSMEFLPLGDGVWLPSRVETLVSGRAFLIVTFRVRQTSTYSNYRRFEVETEERTVR
jgi:hypothetical protein